MHQPPIPHVDSEDPEIADLIHAEALRQHDKIRLIPSENYVSQAVLEATWQTPFWQVWPSGQF